MKENILKGIRFCMVIGIFVMGILSISGSNGGGGGDDNGIADGDQTGGGEVYLTCKVNGASVNIEGTGYVVANYQVNEDETVVQTGGPGQYRFVIVIPENTTGSWSLGDHYLSLSVTRMDTYVTYMSSTDYDDQGAALQVAVTAYGSVGGCVEGTFSGTVVNILDGSTLVITNGEFRASRIGDI